MSASQKTDLLEALEELFSQENLDRYPMNDADWQDIFLILLNSYLHSHAANRKEIFKRLTDKLHEIRRVERQRSSDVYPSISIASPALTDPNEDSTRTPAGHRHYHFGEEIHSHTTRSQSFPLSQVYDPRLAVRIAFKLRWIPSRMQHLRSPIEPAKKVPIVHRATNPRCILSRKTSPHCPPSPIQSSNDRRKKQD